MPENFSDPKPATQHGVRVRHVEYNVHWPIPSEEMAKASGKLWAAARAVWGWLLQEQERGAQGTQEEGDRRHAYVSEAAIDAFVLLQERAAAFAGNGRVLAVPLFASMTATVAMYLASRWEQGDVSPEETVGLTAAFAGYIQEIALDLYAHQCPEKFGLPREPGVTPSGAPAVDLDVDDPTVDEVARRLAERFTRG
jgi:hypothetical protein